MRFNGAVAITFHGGAASEWINNPTGLARQLRVPAPEAIQAKQDRSARELTAAMSP